MTRATISTAIERSAQDLSDRGPGDPMAEELAGWLSGSARFRTFADAHHDKIRKKFRTATDPEALRDVRAELLVAHRLLADPVSTWRSRRTGAVSWGPISGQLPRRALVQPGGHETPSPAETHERGHSDPCEAPPAASQYPERCAARDRWRSGHGTRHRRYRPNAPVTSRREGRGLLPQARTGRQPRLLRTVPAAQRRTRVVRGSGRRRPGKPLDQPVGADRAPGASHPGERAMPAGLMPSPGPGRPATLGMRGIALIAVILALACAGCGSASTPSASVVSSATPPTSAPTLAPTPTPSSQPTPTTSASPAPPALRLPPPNAGFDYQLGGAYPPPAA